MERRVAREESEVGRRMGLSGGGGEEADRGRRKGGEHRGFRPG